MPIFDPHPESGPSIYTFDVFETLLVRTVSPPEEVFSVLGRQARQSGLLVCSATAFGHAREEAQRRAYRRYGRCYTLAHVYDEIALALALSEGDAQALRDLELATEEALLVPVEPARALLAEARAEAGRVLFLSDMYLPSPFIEAQLRRCGMWEEGDRLYVSCEHACSKHGGGLFHYVAQAEGVPVSTIRHVGNNAHSDVEGARRAGATPVFVDAANPSRYEEAMHRHRLQTDGLAAAMAGASRLARLDAPSDPHARALARVAAGVYGPVLTAYVLWVLRRAAAAKLERLYFVSRDGELLVALAERLQPKLGLTLDLRYVYGSRLAWNSAVASQNNAPTLWRSLMWLGSDNVPNEDLLKRPGLTPDEKAEIIQKMGLSKKALASTYRQHLIDALKKPEVAPLLETARARREMALREYFHQEGIFDDVPYGFVDVGWRATLHDVILTLRERNGLPPVPGYFFGLKRSNSPYGALRTGYFMDERNGKGDVPKALSDGMTKIVESVCTSLGGSAVGFEIKHDRVAPLFDETSSGALEGWGLPLVHATVRRFAELLPLDADVLQGGADFRPLMSRLMETFWTAPAPDEAEAWGAYPWEEGQGIDAHTVPLGKPLTLREAFARTAQSPGQLRRPLRWAEELAVTPWPQASLLRSGPLARAAFSAVPAARQGGAKAKRMAGAVVRRVRRVARR